MAAKFVVKKEPNRQVPVLAPRWQRRDHRDERGLQHEGECDERDRVGQEERGGRGLEGKQNFQVQFDVLKDSLRTRKRLVAFFDRAGDYTPRPRLELRAASVIAMRSTSPFALGRFFGCSARLCAYSASGG
jgi:hypothetical protein